MLWRKRRADAEPGGATATIDPPATGQALVEGSLEGLLGEIERLAGAARTAPGRDIERRLVRLRHQAGIRLVEEAPGDAKFVSPAADRLRGACAA